MKKAIDHYKYLHQHPELSENEFNTAKYVYDALIEYGYKSVMLTENGVYADLIVNTNNPYVIFRADMDALPLKEESPVSYKSKIDGVMHACGHDSHTAMLLEAAYHLHNSKLPFNIRFIFQPAEEGTKGARALISKGVLPQNLKAAFSIHVWPDIPKAKIATKTGPIMASGDLLRINCYGKSAHCSKREKGSDALMTAIEIASKFDEIEKSVNDELILFCGSLHGGSSHNIVVNEAYIRGALRTFSEETRSNILNKIKHEIKKIGEKFNVQTELILESQSPVVINDETIVKQIFDIFPDAYCLDAPTYAAEDFSYYLQHCKGAELWLGLGESVPLHDNRFYVPEEILPYGVNAWIKIANNIKI